MNCNNCGKKLEWRNFGSANAPVMEETDWLIDAHNHLNLAQHELIQRRLNKNTREADRLIWIAMDKINLVIALLREKKPYGGKKKQLQSGVHGSPLWFHQDAFYGMMFEVGEEVDINRIPYIVTAFDGQKYIMEIKKEEK
jgi:hypothetical protein